MIFKFTKISLEKMSKEGELTRSCLVMVLALVVAMEVACFSMLLDNFLGALSMPPPSLPTLVATKSSSE
jgi:hypothetical protein